jgi:hypothetical protein
LLPKPREQPTDIEEDEDVRSVQNQLTSLRKTVVIPPYGQRKDWVPRSLEVRYYILALRAGVFNSLTAWRRRLEGLLRFMPW